MDTTEKVIKYNAVIFDLDGVLISTDKYHYKAWKKIADQEGVYFDEVINNKLRGVSRLKSLEIILEKASKIYSLKEKNELCEIKNIYYREMLSTLNPQDVDGNVIELLKVLKKNNVLMAIASSSKNASYIIDKVELKEYFSAIIDGNIISNSKPHPEVFLRAQQALDVPSKECIVVEDSVSGILAAKNGNIDSAYLGNESVAFATYRLNNILDLLNVIFK